MNFRTTNIHQHFYQIPHGELVGRMISKNTVKLLKVNPSDFRFLYELLKKRDSNANISHKHMPTYAEHKRFVKSKPYKVWYVIKHKKNKVGSIYLSKQNEIGIFLLKTYRGKNIAQEALQILMKKNPEKQYLANINPKNYRSTNFFIKNKFKLIQYTYEFIPIVTMHAKKD